MVPASAEVNGPFLKRPEARRGFACVENLGLVTANGRAKPRGEGGDAGQPLQEIHGDPFGHQQRSYIPLQDHDRTVRLDDGSVGDALGDAQRRVDGAKHFPGDGHPGDGHALVGDDRGLRRHGLRKQRTCGDVAVGQVFVERQLNRLSNGLGIERFNGVFAQG